MKYVPVLYVKKVVYKIVLLSTILTETPEWNFQSETEHFCILKLNFISIVLKASSNPLFARQLSQERVNSFTCLFSHLTSNTQEGGQELILRAGTGCYPQAQEPIQSCVPVADISVLHCCPGNERRALDVHQRTRYDGLVQIQTQVVRYATKYNVDTIMTD